MTTESDLKLREDKVRRLARRKGLRLRVDRRRWYRALHGKTYVLVDERKTAPRTLPIILGGAKLEHVERFLSNFDPAKPRCADEVRETSHLLNYVEL